MDIASNNLKHPNTPRPHLNMHKMEQNHVEIVRQWCINEGWNLGLHDAKIYLQIDPNGHFILFDKEEPIGSISLVRHRDDFFTIGPFIVKPEYREKGHGVFIWDKAMSRLNDLLNPSILLYAVEAQVNRYRNLGFNMQHKNLKWELNQKAYKAAKPTVPCTFLTPDVINIISEYDKHIFTASREKIITELLTYPDINGFFVWADNKIKGYGLIRPCILGNRIGPLFADSKEIAKSIIGALLQHSGAENVVIDMPESNKEGVLLMTELEAKHNQKSDTIAMVKGQLSPEYNHNIGKNFGIFSLEIG